MFLEPVEAVTVCVGYADLLDATAPYNAPVLDKWVIVTSPEDTDTQRVCRKFRLKHIVTRDATRDGDFGKGRLVERGLQHLSADITAIHMDADIVLPRDFRHILKVAHLDPRKVYGCDRIMVRSCDEWRRLQASGWLEGATRGHPHQVQFPPGFVVGNRWAGSDGYAPIGFFQMWNRLGSGEEVSGARTKPYPVGHGSAVREDVQFSLQWDRRDRELLAELIVAHLESEPRPRANWHGRTTAPFCWPRMPTASTPNALGHRRPTRGDS